MDWRLFHWVNRLQARTAWAHAPLRVYAKSGIVAFGVLLLVGWWLARARDLGRMSAGMSRVGTVGCAGAKSSDRPRRGPCPAVRPPRWRPCACRPHIGLLF